MIRPNMPHNVSKMGVTTVNPYTDLGEQTILGVVFGTFLLQRIAHPDIKIYYPIGNWVLTLTV